MGSGALGEMEVVIDGYYQNALHKSMECSKN